MLRETYNAKLVLEDGRLFPGNRFGARTDAIGEVVFNTAMSGYQEILTDPSYSGQMVVMTAPQIGNYGIAQDDAESRQLFLSSLIIKELSRVASNWRSIQTLDDHLAANNIPGIEGLDTRALVRHLRTFGAMRGVIANITDEDRDLIARARAHPSMAGVDLASTVTLGRRYQWDSQELLLNGHWHQQDLFSNSIQSSLHVVVYDYGVKYNILRCLTRLGCKVTVVPASTSANDILDIKPDGLLLSNGPGDPDPLTYATDNIKAMLGRLPIAGICLGHQLLALAAGGKTYKLKFGHRGSNHPVIDHRTGKVQITAHNHGFSVDADSLRDRTVDITHINLNDLTVEGLSLRDVPAIAVQYHPEASPGPHDAFPFFDSFIALMKQWQEPHSHA
ncbi:MAG: glutamine-hydrolyzing carbamoyl-phosphate synthase small subunit [bacterium]|nr:glutamine-hydrolyzing carbamoyl-phosphate synthase small subunit [bacterium]